MRTALAVVVCCLSAFVHTTPAVAAECKPLDRPNDITPVRTQHAIPGYRAFVVFDCVEPPTVPEPDAPDAPKQGTVTIKDFTSTLDGSFIAEYRPNAGASGEDTVTIVTDAGTFRLRVALSPTANTPSRCFPWNKPVLGLDEHALIRAGCMDFDGDQPRLIAGAAPLGSLSTPQISEQPIPGLRFTVFDSIYTLTQFTSLAAQVITVAFNVDDGFGPVPADALAPEHPFTVDFPAEHTPTCAAATMQTPYDKPITGRLSCADPDPGDAITILLIKPQEHGELREMRPDGQIISDPREMRPDSQITYDPRPDWGRKEPGVDAFTFAASDGRTLSTPVTATFITRTPENVHARVTNLWAAYDRHVRLRRLVVRDATRGATVEVRCRGKGCPYRRKAIARRPNGTYPATKPFRGRKLRKGAVIEVRILVPDKIGKVVRYEIKPPKVPKGKKLCLPPRAAAPTTCRR